MKLKPPDSSLADYVERRRAFVAALNATAPTPRERLECLKRWVDANSPYSATEKLANLQRALFGDDKPMRTSFPYMAIAKRFGYPYGFVLIAADCIEQGKTIYMPLDLRAAITDAVFSEHERRREAKGI